MRPLIDWSFRLLIARWTSRNEYVLVGKKIKSNIWLVLCNSAKWKLRNEFVVVKIRSNVWLGLNGRSGAVGEYQWEFLGF